MTDTVHAQLLSDTSPAMPGPVVRPRTGTGILPDSAIAAMLREREILTQTPPDHDQLQPSSIDLRLGHHAYRVSSSFLPGRGKKVQDKIEELKDFKMDIQTGGLLERGSVYVIPLLESLNLKSDLEGVANPKSSTGRLDILTRLITDEGTAFDRVREKYAGPLYIEVAPRSFDVVVRTGTRLNQLRFRRGRPSISMEKWKELQSQIAYTDHSGRKSSEPGLLSFTIDLVGGGERDTIIGYCARETRERIDLERISYYDRGAFWEPIAYNGGQLILQPNKFYILMTREPVSVPPEYAAEMMPYDTTAGEFRVHYAGFFDPGFGWNAAAGKTDGRSRAVLEVRSYEVPFLLEHGQPVGGLQYEPMLAVPGKLYGQDIRSNYQGQSLKLAKHFK